MCSPRNTFPEIKTLYIKPGNPWENGHIESFHDKLCDECLNRELFDTDGIATPISNKLPYVSTRFAGTSATIGLNDTIRNTVVQKEKYLSNPRCAFRTRCLSRRAMPLA